MAQDVTLETYSVELPKRRTLALLTAASYTLLGFGMATLFVPMFYGILQKQNIDQAHPSNLLAWLFIHTWIGFLL